MGKKRKIIILLFFLLLLGGGFLFKKIKEKEQQTRYLLARVERGTILVSVSGSGQISSSEEREIKPKVGGEVSEILVKNGQRVKEGEIVLKIDTKNYQRAIEEAEIALESAQNTLRNLEKNKEDTEKDLKETYENAYNLISATFNDLSQIVYNLENPFTKSSYGGEESDIDYYHYLVGFYKGSSHIKQEKENLFINLKEKYQAASKDYFFLSRNAPREMLEEWLEKTSSLVKDFSDLTRNTRDIIQVYKEIVREKSFSPPILMSDTENQLLTINNAFSLLDQRNTALDNLLRSIDKLKKSLSDYEEKISNQEKIVKQKENNLLDAKENYENCFVRAPFDGRISRVNVKKGDNVSIGTPLFGLISEEKMAEIFLNEIDVARVKLDQKAILTFDALPDLTLTGKVIEVDTVGTVSQGVVSYGVKISLDTDDERIKPSMSVTAEIIVEVKNDILTLANGAIKTEGNLKYVNLIDGPEELKKQLKIGSQTILPKTVQIRKQIVETGISNDALIEIISGLKEGDLVVVSRTSSQNNQRQTNIGQFRLQFPRMSPQPLR